MKKVVLSSKEAILVRSLLIPLERKMLYRYQQNLLSLDPRLHELRSLLFEKFGASYDSLNG